MRKNKEIYDLELKNNSPKDTDLRSKIYKRG